MRGGTRGRGLPLDYRLTHLQPEELRLAHSGRAFVRFSSEFAAAWTISAVSWSCNGGRKSKRQPKTRCVRGSEKDIECLSDRARRLVLHRVSSAVDDDQPSVWKEALYLLRPALRNQGIAAAAEDEGGCTDRRKLLLHSVGNRDFADPEQCAWAESQVIAKQDREQLGRLVACVEEEACELTAK
jgi:hypothetical protein